MKMPLLSRLICLLLLPFPLFAEDQQPKPEPERFDEPVVARLQMEFKVEDKVVDVIEKGDLLTVLEAKGDNLLVQTYNGKKGWVAKVNALRLEESVEIYDELITAKPKDLRLYTLRASAHFARKDHPQALADFDKAIAQGYQEPHVYSSRGLFYASLGKYEQALNDYKTALEKGAKDESPYINRAAIFMTQQKYEEAIKEYDQAVKMNDKKPSTFHQRAVAWKLKGDLDRAQKDFDAAIKLNEAYIPALMGRGFLWFQKGDHPNAIKDFTTVLKHDPKSASAYNNRGFNFQLGGDLKSALADFDQAIALAPQFALAHQNRAWVLAAADEPTIRNGKKAIEAAETACKIDNYKVFGDVKALAAAFAEDRQWDKAVGWQEKVIEMATEEQQPTEKELLAKYQGKKPFRLSEAAKNDKPKK